MKTRIIVDSTADLMPDFKLIEQEATRSGSYSSDKHLIDFKLSKTSCFIKILSITKVIARYLSKKKRKVASFSIYQFFFTSCPTSSSRLIP